MGMKRRERKMIVELRHVTGDSSLILDDIVQWNGIIKLKKNERIAHLPKTGVIVVYKVR
jgi:hypothetical protein